MLPPPLDATARGEFFLSLWFNFSPPLPNTGMLGPLCRGPRSVLVNLLAGFAFPLMPLPGADFFSSGARETLRVTPEKFEHRTAVLILL
jgi:hypothetical protein